MPSLQTYRRMLKPLTNGDAHKVESDMVMEETWYDDIQTRTAYFYDYKHDDHPRQFEGLSPENDVGKVPISIKYIENSSQTFSKDEVTYHIMFRPFQNLNAVEYYEQDYKERWGATFPCGLYVDIPDERGRYNKWLVVGMAQSNNAQFPTYEILRVNYLFTWIFNRTKYQMGGVQRTQNSYTSGVWQDYVFETPNDIISFILPMNDVTSNLTYNQRLIVDAKVDVNSGAIPRVWQISKVSRTTPYGLGMYTATQDIWDANRDFVEYEIEGDPSSIIGMYADYYGENTPDDSSDVKPIDPDKHIVVTFTGVSQSIKTNGNYKKITAAFYEGETPVAYDAGTWSYTVDGVDVSSLITEDFTGLDPNQVRIKFADDTNYVGKILTVSYTSIGGIVGTLTLAIAGL